MLKSGPTAMQDNFINRVMYTVMAELEADARYSLGDRMALSAISITKCMISGKLHVLKLSDDHDRKIYDLIVDPVENYTSDVHEKKLLLSRICLRMFAIFNSESEHSYQMSQLQK